MRDLGQTLLGYGTFISHSLMAPLSYGILLSICCHKQITATQTKGSINSQIGWHSIRGFTGWCDSRTNVLWTDADTTGLSICISERNPPLNRHSKCTSGDLASLQVEGILSASVSTLPDYPPGVSGYRLNLLVSCTGHQISRTIWTKAYKIPYSNIF